MSGLWPLARPFLFGLNAETAHRMALRALAAGVMPRAPAPDPSLRRKLLGLDFGNPLGMAAGLDKNGEVPDAVLGLGFGFVEVGTVTPRPQKGNAPPRVFRLVEHQALINRLGFNNEGHDAVHARLAKRTRRGIVGVNVGANKDSPDRIADYALGVERFAGVADYIAVNISSPNTPGLRNLHEANDLAALLKTVVATRDGAARRVPLLVKISPDLDDDALEAVVRIARESGVEGLIVTNTTVSRDSVAGHPLGAETGGLSGRPLFGTSTAMLAKVRRLAGNELVLVGVGGIDSAEAAMTKILAGADLLQLYTGMVYRGPGLAREIVAGLPRLMAKRPAASTAEAAGRNPA